MAKPLLAMVGLLFTGAFIFLVMPLYVGALQDSVGLDHQQSALMTSIEMVGVVLASLLGLVVVRRVSWAVLGRNLSLLLLIANGFSWLSGADFPALLFSRLMAGIAAGGLVALSITAIGDTRNLDRNFALAVVAELLGSGVAFKLLPTLIDSGGIVVIFASSSALALMAFALSGWMPLNGQVAARSNSKRVWKPVWGLLAIVAFFVAQSSLWAFVERIGLDAGFNLESVAQALSLSMLAGAAGALLALGMHRWVSRMSMMSICALGQIISLTGFLAGVDFTHYLLAGMLFQFCWNLWLPAQMAMVADADTGGIWMPLVGACQAIGIAAGPSLVVSVLVPGSWTAVTVVCGAFIVMSLLLFSVLNFASSGKPIIVCSQMH
ncbi:MFS transporter [Pseudomaricurvus alkylphenolicus]|uniref:MFS transporter n=1 Tax=Pseudomaricurvus alkylphenolicus TaxID=1306991 RepID=UPI00142008BA|nr:MFS transporter [Pseudomaricurvus alkylphenolicus]NIB44190.1 MFS transporter [Pseudomaricurvus alkylphenolicus]